jgi:hypothetical protein
VPDAEFSRLHTNFAFDQTEREWWSAHLARTQAHIRRIFRQRRRATDGNDICIKILLNQAAQPSANKSVQRARSHSTFSPEMLLAAWMRRAGAAALRPRPRASLTAFNLKIWRVCIAMVEISHPAAAIKYWNNQFYESNIMNFGLLWFHCSLAIDFQQQQKF